MRFSVGEVAILINTGAFHRDIEGRECTIVSPPGGSCVKGFPPSAYEVRVQGCSNQIWVAFPQDLRKKYDGNELVSWDECIWQPETVKGCDG